MSDAGHHARNIDMGRAGYLTGSGTRNEADAGFTSILFDMSCPFFTVFFQGSENGRAQ